MDCDYPLLSFRINWSASAQMLALFVKNLFLGPFTVARVSARLNTNTADTSEPPSDPGCQDESNASAARSSRGGRWWPAAVALGGLFYTSLACQVSSLHYNRHTTTPNSQCFSNLYTFSTRWCQFIFQHSVAAVKKGTWEKFCPSKHLF